MADRNDPNYLPPFHFVFPECDFIWYSRENCGVTRFSDGLELPAAPEDTDEYRGKAIELGYGIYSTDQMCLEHEYIHSWLAVNSGKAWSPTLHYEAAVKAGRAEEVSLAERVREENSVLLIQKSLNGVGDFYFEVFLPLVRILRPNLVDTYKDMCFRDRARRLVEAAVWAEIRATEVMQAVKVTEHGVVGLGADGFGGLDA